MPDERCPKCGDEKKGIASDGNGTGIGFACGSVLWERKGIEQSDKCHSRELGVCSHCGAVWVATINGKKVYSCGSDEESQSGTCYRKEIESTIRQQAATIERLRNILQDILRNESINWGSRIAAEAPRRIAGYRDVSPLDPKLEKQIERALSEPAPPPPTHCHDCKREFAPGDKITFGRCVECFVKECNSDNDYCDYEDCESCYRCGGDGHIEYLEAPETWGEDCPSEVNHLVVCPDCGGSGHA